jgi:hypothetical protein
MFPIVLRLRNNEYEHESLGWTLEAEAEAPPGILERAAA